MKKLLIISLLIMPLSACSWFKTKNVGADLPVAEHDAAVRNRGAEIVRAGGRQDL